VLDVRVLPRGPLRSGEAGPNIGCPRALAGGTYFPCGNGILVIVCDDKLLLDPSGPELEELASRERR
jgi:hypothetical protein